MAQVKIVDRFDGKVRELVLSSPPANILDAQMMSSILNELRRALGVKGLRAVVFKGEGQHFSYGASVEEHTPKVVGGMLPQFHEMIGEVLACPVPTLAQVSGLCLGGGFELALACGFIFADHSAKFAVPEIGLGVFPPVAALLLPHKGPEALAHRMVIGGERVLGRELADLGLISQTCEPGQLDSLVGSWLEKNLVPKSASSLRMAQRALRASTVDFYKSEIGRLERMYLDELMSTHDAVEGIEAFLAKRTPRWTDA